MLFVIKKLSSLKHRTSFWLGIFLIWVLLFHLQAAIAGAVEKSVEVNSKVPPHRWSAIQLSNVNQGATLEVKLYLDGQATVILVSESQLKNYPNVARPLFRTVTRSRAMFSIVAPRSGNYFLIVDNRKGATKRKYSLSITARLDLSGNRSLGAGRLTGHNSLKLLSQAIQKAFEGDPLKFKLTTCESSNTITRGVTIYLCQEYLKRINERFKEKQDINAIVLYELMKEAGYALLRRWHYPLINSPKVKDEFATTLLLMFGREDAVEAQVKYSTVLEPEKEERSETIKKWLDDPRLVKKWQPYLIPKMQTSYLRFLKKERPSWASRKLINRELIRRQ